MNKQNIIQGIFSLYKLHKYLKNLTYTNYTNNPYEQFAIHKTFQLYETNIINIFNMYNIENKYNTTNTIINFGILFNKHSIYRNHTILSFLHPFNIHLSELCKNNTTYTENISNNLYIKHNIDETNTINTNIIVTPLQSILLWKKCLPIENMNILILTHTNQLFKINETILSSYNAIIVSSNIWNKFSLTINKYNKFILRLIIDEIDMININNSISIKYKFLWILGSDQFAISLIKLWDKPLWTNEFINICLNIYKTDQDFLNALYKINNNNYDYMTDEYINSISNDTDYIEYNLKSIINTNYKYYNFNKIYNTPNDIFISYAISYEILFPNLKNGFFKNILLSILQSVIYINTNNITSANSILEINNLPDIQIERCLIEDNHNNKQRFISSIDDNNIDYYSDYDLYFQCYNDLNNLLQSNHINYNELQRIINNNDNTCPICYNDIVHYIFITSCCKHKLHCKCLFNCFKNKQDMTCPICREQILFRGSFIIDQSFLNNKTYEPRMNIIQTHISNYNNILIISQYIYEYYYSDALILNNNSRSIKSFEKLMNSNKKKVILIHFNDIDYFRTIDFTFINLIILTNIDIPIYKNDDIYNRLSCLSFKKDVCIKNIDNIF